MSNIVEREVVNGTIVEGNKLVELATSGHWVEFVELMDTATEDELDDTVFYLEEELADLEDEKGVDEEIINYSKAVNLVYEKLEEFD